MAQARELSSLSQNGVGTFSDIAGTRPRQTDEHTLARLGKQQVLKVSLDIQVPWQP